MLASRFIGGLQDEARYRRIRSRVRTLPEGHRIAVEASSGTQRTCSVDDEDRRVPIHLGRDDA